MKKEENYRKANMGPVAEKTFSAALERFFIEHCPQLGGTLTRQALAVELIKLVEEYYPPHSHMRMGQVMWPAVDEKETGSYGKTISMTQQTPVFLDLISQDDLNAYLNGEKASFIKRNAAVRIFKQAKNQGGVLTCSDVAAMLKLSPSTISRYVRLWEKEHEELVPRRGTVHDMGPSLTHKKEICFQIICEGRTVEEVQKSTNHTPEAITRYVVDYKRIASCLAAGMSNEETAYAVHRSPRLVEEYKDLIEENQTIKLQKGED